MQNIFTSLTQGFSDLSSLESLISLDLILQIILGYLLIIWLACAIWVIKDITTRSTSIFVQVFSILLIIVLTPVFGLPLYLLIRPRTTLFEQYYEETSLESLEESMSSHHCKNCQEELPHDAKYCSSCGHAQGLHCEACWKPLVAGWKYCMHCGKSLGEKSSSPRKASKKKVTPEAETSEGTEE